MRNSAILCLLLACLTLAVFGQMWDHGFIVMDDHLYVTGNPHVRTGLSWENVRWAFTRIHDANYIPLTWVSLMLDAELFGEYAGGYHLSSLLLHIANTLLLFGVLRAATADSWKSGFVAALFAVHPLHVESVAWLPERKDVLSTFFGMLALGGYVRYARNSSKMWYVLSLFALLASLLAKQMLVTLPLVLLLLDYWPLRRLRLASADLMRDVRAPSSGRSSEESADDALAESNFAVAGNSRHVKRDHDQSMQSFAPRSLSRLLLEKTPFLLLAVVFSAIVFFAQRQGGAVRSLEQYPLSVRTANAAVAAIIYIEKTFWPQGLAVYYPHPGKMISGTAAAGAAAILVAVTLLSLLAARRHPYVTVGWFWYLATLLPVIGLVQIGTQRMADRYTYIPLIGLFFAATWVVPQLLPDSRWSRAVLPAVSCVIIAVLAVVAWRQTSLWQSSIGLFRHALAVTEKNAAAHLNLGKALRENGRIEESVEQFCQALSINSTYPAAHNNLGVALYELGRLDKGAGHLEEAIRLDPDYATAYFNLGNLLRDRNNLDRAVALYEKALQLEPDNLAAINNLSNVLSKLGRLDEALHCLQEAKRIEPDDVNTLINLGIALHGQGNVEEAIASLRRAVHLDPNSAAAHYNLGAALYSRRRFDEARHQFEVTLRLVPEHDAARRSLVSALLSLGSRLADQGRLTEALGHFRRARELDPANWRTAYNLGAAHAAAGNTGRAVELYLEALAHNPEAAEAHNALGRLHLEQGRRIEAIEHFQRALDIKPDFAEARRNLAAARGQK